MSNTALNFTILGCGSSPGVPRIHGDWGACDPLEPKNRRLRASMMVERIGPNGRTTVIVDTSPDFRQQMLAANVQSIDGVLYTHPHADHVHGIDDLRGYVLVQRERMPVYADAQTLERLLQGFGYCFEKPDGSMYPPILEANEIVPLKPVTIDGEGGPITALPITQVHGPINSLAFRFYTSRETCEAQLASGILSGGLCYSPDVSEIPEESIPYLQKLDCWIIDALQYKNHISHLSLEQALEWIDHLEPERAVLTHMHTPMDYQTLLKELPSRVRPAYDGMSFQV